MAWEGKGRSPGYEGSQSGKTRNGNYSLISQMESHRLAQLEHFHALDSEEKWFWLFQCLKGNEEAVSVLVPSGGCNKYHRRMVYTQQEFPSHSSGG